MDPKKVGEFIKELRKKNHLTQEQFANKYRVTYQAVSKWENGNNLPDVALLQKMSKDFNVSMDDILNGATSKRKRRKLYVVLSIIVLLIALVILLILENKKEESSFDFKTLSTTCKEFKVSGSLAYDKNKSTIYISHIDYCNDSDEERYKEIKCDLYEKKDKTNTIISSCDKKEDITLEAYLKEIELKANKYNNSCKNYNDDSFYLEISATDKKGKTNIFKIPLSLNECKK